MANGGVSRMQLVRGELAAFAPTMTANSNFFPWGSDPVGASLPKGAIFDQLQIEAYVEVAGGDPVMILTGYLYKGNSGVLALQAGGVFGGSTGWRRAVTTVPTANSDFNGEEDEPGPDLALGRMQIINNGAPVGTFTDVSLVASYYHWPPSWS